MLDLGIISYGISVTTLEEVFLKVGHGIKDESVAKVKVIKAERNDKVDNYSIASNPAEQSWGAVSE
jgi:hypothetical protein